MGFAVGFLNGVQSVLSMVDAKNKCLESANRVSNADNQGRDATSFKVDIFVQCTYVILEGLKFISPFVGIPPNAAKIISHGVGVLDIARLVTYKYANGTQTISRVQPKDMIDLVATVFSRGELFGVASSTAEKLRTTLRFGIVLSESKMCHEKIIKPGRAYLLSLAYKFRMLKPTDSEEAFEAIIREEEAGLEKEKYAYVQRRIAEYGPYICPVTKHFLVEAVAFQGEEGVYVNLSCLEGKSVIQINERSYPTKLFSQIIDSDKKRESLAKYNEFRYNWLESLEQKIITEILAITRFRELNVIPSFYENKESLRAFTCSITQKPIRFIMAPKNYTGSVFYDKESIVRWIRENPMRFPPGWPTESTLTLPMTLGHFSSQTEIQEQIDSNLESLSNEMILSLDRADSLQRVRED